MKVIAESSVGYQPASLSEVAPKIQFNALTALRFFACSVIIFLHSAWFFFDIEFMKNWQLDEGVAFFFVLSGFILTYVYPDLRGKENIKHFLVNRLGRMVPSHIVLTFVTLIVLPCSCATLGVFLANLFLVQSWIPRREYYFGLNAVAWSICVEIFFSFAFVLLIRPWKWGWTGKVVLGLLLTVFACIWAHIFVASGSHSFFKFNEEYLLKINPLVRLFDFILGMSTAVLFIRFNHLIKLGTYAVTFIEIVLISIILFEITQINNLIESVFPALKHYPEVTYWITHGGCAPIFSMVIFLMAMERGYIAKLFANRMFVWLGEVSFSMYMVHFVLIQCLNFYLPEFGKINWPIMYPIYLAMVVLLSYLNFNLIENPARKFIKAIVSSSKKYRFSFSSIWQFFKPNLPSTGAAAVMATVLAMGAGAYVNASQSRFHYRSLDVGNGISFEDCFRLQKIGMASAYDGSKIILTWQSLKSQIVNCSIQINGVGKTGNMLEQYEQTDMFPLRLKSGQVWSETIYMHSSASQRAKWEKLGLRLSIQVQDSKHHHGYQFLTPTVGDGSLDTLDWWNTRLLIPLSKQVL